MIIHNSGHVHTPHFQSQSMPAQSGNRSAGASIRESAAASIDTTSMENLLSVVSGGSEVREQLVENIKLKLQTGEYLTQAAAVETADAILNL